jgi:protein tyrosine phosphatase
LEKERFHLWLGNPHYEPSHSLVNTDGAREKNCIAFAYNNTAEYYNASTIYLSNFRCIACEGPRSKDISKFFRMLTENRVTHLVRLTPSHEGDLEKCHPYWKGLLQPTSKGVWQLNIPVDDNISYPIRNFILEEWKDNSGIDPRLLLAFVRRVRKELQGTQDLLAVHCSAGVGRTGTFLAALEILDALDQGKPFSIQEIVYRLSVQRVNSVGHACQYVTLHRLAEEYQRVLMKA